MKQALIYKGFAPEELTGEDLERINRYTRRELKAEELYVFPLVLCDNEVDRDYERFSIEALHKLRRLFLGKTGIFDHNPKGENQTARIFYTAVEQDALRKTAAGEPYHFLTAKAYMARSEKNRDLIFDIDAGIKKEVSVGCAVKEAICSICGSDARLRPCGHVSGKTYDGALCHYTLQKPTDAYEWSFVAVPAQPAAGVTKAYRPDDCAESVAALRLKLKAAQGGLALAGSEAILLENALEELEQLAAEGAACREELKKEVLRAAVLAGGMSQKTVSGIADKLTANELRELKKTLTLTAPEAAPMVQTAGQSARAAQPEDNARFLI